MGDVLQGEFMVIVVRTEAEYTAARPVVDALIDEIGDDESHPLAEVLDYLSDRTPQSPSPRPPLGGWRSTYRD